MEPDLWVSYTTAYIAIATLALLLLSRWFLLRPKLNLLPGPKPWPLIGNLNLMGPLPHQSIHQLSKKYGPIMQLRFGSFPVVVGSSVEMAKLFFKTHDSLFLSRPRITAGKHLSYNYSGILWSPYGPYWLQARKICSTELFSAKRLDSFEYMRKEEVNSMIKAIHNSIGKPIQLKNHLSTMSLNVICRMVLGKKYEENTSVPPNELKKMLDEFFLLSGVLNIGDYIPLISFLDLQGYVKRMKALSKKFDRLLENVLDEHNERRKGVEGYVAKDVVDVLLQLADNSNLEVKLERNGVKAIVQDIIIGGTQSSAITVEWAMSELLKKPEIFDKASEELDRVIGRERWVEEKDIVNLPYIDAIVKETMRLHPAAPMLVPRMAREDCQIEGYHIEKGTRVVVNVWTIGRDPTVWKNPELFDPERFIGKDVNVKGQNFEILPFGSGRRMCPGYNLGLKIIQTNLANLLHGFCWKLVEDMKEKDLNMEELAGISTLKKFPLHAVAKPRLPSHLY